MLPHRYPRRDPPRSLHEITADHRDYRLRHGFRADFHARLGRLAR